MGSASMLLIASALGRNASRRGAAPRSAILAPLLLHFSRLSPSWLRRSYVAAACGLRPALAPNATQRGIGALPTKGGRNELLDAGLAVVFRCGEPAIAACGGGLRSGAGHARTEGTTTSARVHRRCESDKTSFARASVVAGGAHEVRRRAFPRASVARNAMQRPASAGVKR
jgi:hypothetical protein